MTTDFNTVFDRIMGIEGGYTDGKGDPGGETNWGISKRSYPDVDIKNLTREQAKAIFHRDFWNKVKGEGLYDGVAYQVSDFAYNSGPETAIRYLQRAVKAADDGHWGPHSQACAQTMGEAATILRLVGLRLEFMASLKNWSESGRGWARRIAANLKYGAEDL